MGKVFITDEVNDNYTVKVTPSSGALHTCGENNSFFLVTAPVSAAEIISAVPCWLHSVTIGSYPATASTLYLLNIAAVGQCASSYCVSGDNITAVAAKIANVAIPIAALGASANLAGLPRTLIYDLYCSTGLGYALTGAVGGVQNITLTYRT